MFGLLRERRSRTVMSHVTATMLEGVETLSPVDRAATLAIAHGMLKVAAERWGRHVIERPSALPQGVAATIVVMLADAHAKVLATLRALEGRGMGDSAYSQAMRQLRATELVIGVVGRRFADKPASQAVSDGWKALWTARARAEEAADVLVRFRETTGADAVPRPAGAKRPLSRTDLVALASTLPAVFRKPGTPRKAAPPRATTSGTPAATASTASRPGPGQARPTRVPPRPGPPPRRHDQGREGA